MLHKFDVLTEEVSSVKIEVSSVKTEVKNLDKRLNKVEEEIIKLNLITSQNSLSLMKLADNDDRISRLETAVFKK